MCREEYNPCKLLSALWAGSTSIREPWGGRSSLNPPLQGARAVHAGQQEALLFICSSACWALPCLPLCSHEETRKGNISTIQHEQRKQQFPCPSLAVTALIQDVGMKHSSTSTRWKSDPSVQFCKGWISSEIGELNSLNHCVKWPVWKLLGWSTAGRAACLWLRWHECATAFSHEEKNRSDSDNGNSRTVQVQGFMYENQGSYSFQI